MRTLIVISFAILLSASAQVDTLLYPFEGWKRLQEQSSDIVIARCMRTPPVPVVRHGGLINADAEVVSVLKGTNSLGPGVFTALDERWPKQGEYFLFFAAFYNRGAYKGNEGYRLIPLGLSFSTNVLAGKTLDEQIQYLLQQRLDDLNHQMAIEQEEKRILEQGVKK